MGGESRAAEFSKARSGALFAPGDGVGKFRVSCDLGAVTE